MSTSVLTNLTVSIRLTRGELLAVTVLYHLIHLTVLSTQEVQMRGYNISSAIHRVCPVQRRVWISTDAIRQILGFQAAFKSSILNPFTFRTMSSISSIDPDINRTLSYWFDGPEPMKKWFRGGPHVDAEIKSQFGSLVQRARAEELDESWNTEPKGALALILLLDQFPRNIYRGSPVSFSSDAHAVKVTTQAIARGFDRQVPHMQQVFFYMPLMHDESLLSQIAGIAMFESLSARCDPESEVAKHAELSVPFARSHRDCILHFGRFPARNEVLGRKSTPGEIAYLKENPSGLPIPQR